MTYVPHTERDTREMLAAIGVARREDLFADVPAAVCFGQVQSKSHKGLNRPI
jgi:glycine cleavage system pyridoxal-binding protein P